MDSLKGGQFRKHTRIKLERRPNTRWDWVGITIILGAAFIAANFVFQENYLFDQASIFQNFLAQEQFESIKSTIQQGR